MGGPLEACLGPTVARLGHPPEVVEEAATGDRRLVDTGALADMAAAKVARACMAIVEEGGAASVIKVVPVAGEVTTKDLPRKWPTPSLSPTCRRTLERFSWLNTSAPLA